MSIWYDEAYRPLLTFHVLLELLGSRIPRRSLRNCKREFIIYEVHLRWTRWIIFIIFFYVDNSLTPAISFYVIWWITRAVPGEGSACLNLSFFFWTINAIKRERMVGNHLILGLEQIRKSGKNWLGPNLYIVWQFHHFAFLNANLCKQSN